MRLLEDAAPDPFLDVLLFWNKDLIFRKFKLIVLSKVLSYILVNLPTTLHFYIPVFGVIVCRTGLWVNSDQEFLSSCVLFWRGGYSGIAIFPGKVQSSLLDILSSEISLSAEILVTSFAYFSKLCPNPALKLWTCFTRNCCFWWGRYFTSTKTVLTGSASVAGILEGGNISVPGNCWWKM